MTPQKQLKLFQCKQAFEKQRAFILHELRENDRTGHLTPVLEFLEWLVRDMSEIAGITAEVKGYAQSLAVLCAQVAAQRYPKPPAVPLKRAKLRLVK